MSDKILVVDDEEDVVNVLKSQLEKSGFSVDTALDGQEGLDLARKYTPQLILTDIVMPNLDGLEFYKQLKKDKLTAHIPVVILSAWGSKEKSFRELGVTDFLVKPFTIQTVINRVKALLQRSLPVPAMTCNILVSENDANVIKKIIHKFEYQGFPIDLKIITFRTQEDILSHTENDHPKVLLLDLLSNDIPIEESIRKIRSDAHLQKTPIVIHGHWMLTGSMKVNERENIRLLQQTYLAAGADYFVDHFNEFSFLLMLYEFFPESLHGL